MIFSVFLGFLTQRLTCNELRDQFLMLTLLPSVPKPILVGSCPPVRQFRGLRSELVGDDRSISRAFGKGSTLRATSRAGQGRPGSHEDNQQEIAAFVEEDSVAQPSCPWPSMLDHLNLAVRYPLLNQHRTRASGLTLLNRLCSHLSNVVLVL